MLFSVDNGNSENRTTEEELPMSCSSADQSCLQFHKNPDDQRNDDELCKISHWLCQGTKIIIVSTCIHNFKAYCTECSRIMLVAR